MRIIELNPFHYPYRGGIEHRVHEISKRLSSKHEMIVLTSRLPGTSEEEKMDGYTVLRLKSEFVNIYNPPFVKTANVLDAINELKPDLVDFHYRWARSYSDAMKRYDGDWVFTFHNTFGEGEGIMRPMSILNDAIFCHNVLKERRVICVTEFVRNDLISRGFDQNALDVVPTGVSPANRGSTEEDYILFTGRLVSTKGIKYLIRAMNKVDCKLKIMGSGPEERRLKALISKLGLQDKIELTGHVDEVTKESTMAACKIFVMPSLFESLGLATAEAMTYGKPIIASSIGGLPEIVGDGGVFVPPKDPDAISTALNKLLHDDVLRAGYGNAALKQVDKYSWEHIIPKIEGAYGRAIRNTT